MTFNSTHPQCLFASMDLGKPPGGLRSIQPFLTIYKQFIKRDPVVSYFGRSGGEFEWTHYAKFCFISALKHAVREGIQGINAPGRDAAVKAESKAYLTTLLDVLEEVGSTWMWTCLNCVTNCR